tara:strand:+ start:71 stop:1036 length:966 start_codon:yes stop_codon:yes gene_type:complete
MNFKPILIVAGEPNSIFLEIFLKSIKNKKIKNPIILIASLKLLQQQMRKLKVNKKINIIINNNIKSNIIKKNEINLINVNYYQKRAFEKISKKSNKYISDSFILAFNLIKKFKISKFINGPINKKTFLNKNYLGITEYVSKKFNVNKTAMLIYNKKLSVCPLTTHLPLKYVARNINKENIIDKVKLIDEFYKTKLKKKPKIAVLGLNPHCESVDKYNEDERIIFPTIKYLKKRNFKVSGPHSADTIFLKNNRKNYDVILGMYHDQVLTPIKTLFEYDAINITLGLPFTRITPDHGPNEKMMGKNLSNPLSLILAINFLEKN